MWQFWIISAGVFLILESITTGFLVFWFSIGSLFALVTSFLTDSIIVQTAVFVISSTILIFATRKFANKFEEKEEEQKITNSFVGKEGKVTITIEPIENKGQIRVGGETWSATSKNDTVIKEGTKVLVQDVDGVKAIVTPIN